MPWSFKATIVGMVINMRSVFQCFISSFVFFYTRNVVEETEKRWQVSEADEASVLSAVIDPSLQAVKLSVWQVKGTGENNCGWLSSAGSYGEALALHLVCAETLCAVVYLFLLSHTHHAAALSPTKVGSGLGAWLAFMNRLNYTALSKTWCWLVSYGIQWSVISEEQTFTMNSRLLLWMQFSLQSLSGSNTFIFKSKFCIISRLEINLFCPPVTVAWGSHSVDYFCIFWLVSEANLKKDARRTL